MGTARIPLWLVCFYFDVKSHTYAGGDNGELVAAACSFGVAHPPGYPLFTMLLELFFLILPYGTHAWRGNVLSGIFGGAACAMVALTVQLCTRRRLPGYPFLLAVLGVMRMQDCGRGTVWHRQAGLGLLDAG